MKGKIVIAVLGNRNSGKSTTWYELFGEKVRTGRRVRRLYLTESEFVEVFVVSGSPEERDAYVGKIIGKQSPRIVLCSVQYLRSATDTIDYFIENGYSIYVHWLNPGYSDAGQLPDSIGLLAYFLYRGATISIREGKTNPRNRVEEIRGFLYGWAKSRNLIRT
jgi:hypothetical protein